ncbi:hypothetical protein ACJRO7_007914 [Eucalyptus globulus]|uniref:MtN19-like protein n=1 Tax=Eucalyptus globulus TaxID=34317 RepID=A0ABD3IPX8_EUCGL
MRLYRGSGGMTMLLLQKIVGVSVVIWVTVMEPRAAGSANGKLKSATFLSPKFVLGPGSVEDKYYFDIDFPRGHVALKSFDAEVVDEDGIPVPLHQTYLHHWVVARYHAPLHPQSEDDYEFARNSGICQRHSLGQYYGLGSETRKTATFVPDPYGIEVGNPADLPAGQEEKWMLNVHAIDTRGVEDRLGCTECRCDLYNVTQDAYGRPLRPGYTGGLYCCYDQTRCRLRPGFRGPRRSLYLRYTVAWFDWDASILPVDIYILDVTDTWTAPRNSSEQGAEEHHCRVEYDVESCNQATKVDDLCIDSKRTSLALPTGGYVVYGVAHQHSGGLGSNLYGEDGRIVCSSVSVYGTGKEAGNEAGYIVGMSTCYPQPGSVKINDGEILVLESNYSKSQNHTGVMGLFYLLVARDLPSSVQMQRNMALPRFGGAILTFLGVVIAIAVGISLKRRKQREEGYESLMT